MKNYLLNGLIIVSVIFGSGVYTGTQLFKTEPEIKIIEKTKIEYKTIERDYGTYSQNELVKELYKYDRGIPRLDGKMKDNIFHASAGLGDREWSRDFKLDVKVKSTSNWRYYVGIGGVATIIGGAMVWKLKK